MKKEELIKKYVDDLKEKCDIDANIDILKAIVDECGESIYDNDESKVASSDKEELDVVKNDFLIKKLGLEDSTALDEGLNSAIEKYGVSNRFKYRPVLYYLLTLEFNKQGIFEKPKQQKTKTEKKKTAKQEIKKPKLDFIKIAEESFASEKKNFPKFKSGDTITVAYRIVELNKERIQQYKGNVIRISGHGDSKRFTVRKISDNIGVERIFPMNSPFIENIVLNSEGKVRRAKLYYLRALRGKKARIKKKVY